MTEQPPAAEKPDLRPIRIKFKPMPKNRYQINFICGNGTMGTKIIEAYDAVVITDDLGELLIIEGPEYTGPATNQE